MRSSLSGSTLAAVLGLFAIATAHADEGADTEDEDAPTFAVSGLVETFYQWNFNDPDNGLTNFRGFDNRHNSLTLANAVLDGSGTAGPVSVRVALQIGHTPQTYYLAEPVSPGANGAGPTDGSVWKFLQQANIGYRAPVGDGLAIEAGLFLSPIGFEGIAVKDQWNWSRSNLFFGLPFYHTGARATYPLADGWSGTVAVYNGWNSVVDNNRGKSVAGQVVYTHGDSVSWSLLYFGGNERPGDAPEGHPWRHLLDSWISWNVTSSLSVAAHGDVGLERNDFGSSYWAAGAVYARVRPLPWLYVSGRADLFYEEVADEGANQAAAIFWPSPWLTSQTLTADLRPAERVSLRLELRHDRADDPMFFRGAVATDSAGAFIADAESQTTLTVGVTTGF
jgi:hypothetical protein